MNIIDGAAGVGTLDTFLSATDGTLNATDNVGVANTHSCGALQSVGAGVQISITAQNAITFDAALASPIALQTGAANSAQFIALNGNISFGQVTDSLTTAGGTITFVATNGSISLGTLDSNNGSIDIFSDVVDVAGTINAGTGIVSIHETTNGLNIDVGTESPGSLSLTQAELNRVTAGVLRIGAVNSGVISITSAITLTTVPTLSLFAGGQINDGGAGTLNVAKLQASSANIDVSLDNAGNDVDSFSGRSGAAPISDSPITMVSRSTPSTASRGSATPPQYPATSI